MKNFLLVLGSFIILTLIVTFPLIFNLSRGFYGPFFGTDMRGAVWSLWWIKYAFTHRLDAHFCPFIGAPFGTETPNFLNFWISLNFSKWMNILTNPVIFLNIAMLAFFILTGVLAYRLVYILTRSSTAGFLSATMFAFSPYVLNKMMEFGYSFQPVFLVFYVLTLLRLKERISFKNIVIAGIALALVADFNAYYGFFAGIFSVGLLIFCFFYQWKKKISLFRDILLFKTCILKGLLLPLALFCVVVVASVIEFPIINQAARVFFQSPTNIAQGTPLNLARSFDYLIAQSARPLSYLLPASTHPVFGNFTKSMFGSIFYGRGSIEQTLYLGWVPLILAFVAFRQWKKKRLHPNQHPDYLSSNENFYIGFFIFSAWLAFLFSMPPIVDLGLFKLYFPSYFTYKILPMFRAYARFGVIVMLCVSVLAGFGIKFILEKIRSKKVKWFFLTFIFFAIIFEFTNMPPVRVADLTKVPEVYAWLMHQPGDFIIAEYPMTKSSPGEAWSNYDYLYYQTKHQKRMINAVLPGTKAFEIKMKIMRVADPMTPRILKGLGVKYIILHSDLYAEGNHPGSVDIDGEIPQLEKIKGYRLIKAFGNDFVYEVNTEPVNLDSLFNDNNGGGRAKNN